MWDFILRHCLSPWPTQEGTNTKKFAKSCSFQWFLTRCRLGGVSRGPKSHVLPKPVTIAKLRRWAPKPPGCWFQASIPLTWCRLRGLRSRCCSYEISELGNFGIFPIFWTRWFFFNFWAYKKKERRKIHSCQDTNISETVIVCSQSVLEATKVSKVFYSHFKLLLFVFDKYSLLCVQIVLSKTSILNNLSKWGKTLLDEPKLIQDTIEIFPNSDISWNTGPGLVTRWASLPKSWVRAWIQSLTWCNPCVQYLCSHVGLFPYNQLTELSTAKEGRAHVEFARAQVVSLVWVCGNILWEASSSKAFYKAAADAA